MNIKLLVRAAAGDRPVGERIEGRNHIGGRDHALDPRHAQEGQSGAKMYFKNLLINAAVLTSTMAVSLSLLEIIMRFFYAAPPVEMDAFSLSSSPYYQTDAHLGWVPRPNVQGTHNQYGSFSSTFRTNSQGFRDKEYPLTKAEGITRIVVIGDSFTWGYGVNDRDIYTERLEAMLPNVETINLGVTAYNLRKETLYFKRQGIKYSPDIVILGFCLNDIYRDKYKTTEKKKVSLAETSGGEITPKRSTFRTYLWSLKQHLRYNSALYRFVIDRINTNRSLVTTLVSLGIKKPLYGIEELDDNVIPALREFPDSLKLAWEETKLELLQLKQLAVDAGIRLIIVMIPSVQSVQTNTFEQTIAGSVFTPEAFDLDKPYRLLEEFALAHDIELVNPVSLFKNTHAEGTNLYLNRDIHFDATGHDLLASAIAQYLR